MKTKQIVSVSLFISLVPAIFVGGCSSSAGTGTLVGSGVGGLIGYAASEDAAGTLIGAGVGAGAGYLIGNAMDKNRAKDYDYSTPTPLTGTRWMVTDLTMENKPEYRTIVVDFTPDGKLITTRVNPDGSKTVKEEKYRIVDNTLIINKEDYIVNAQYVLTGDQLVVTAEDFKAVLKKV